MEENNDRKKIINAINFLKEEGLISENNIKMVLEGKIRIDDLSQIAAKKFYCNLTLIKQDFKEEIEFIDLRSEEDIKKEIPIELTSLNIFLNMI